MHNIFTLPSVYAHAFNGLLMLLAIIILYRNYAEIKRLDSYKRLILTLLFSLAVGIHGLSHLGLETAYGVNVYRTFS